MITLLAQIILAPVSCFCVVQQTPKEPMEMKIAKKFLEGPFWVPRKNLSTNEQKSLFQRFDLIAGKSLRQIERGIGLALETEMEYGDLEKVGQLDWNINIFAHYKFRLIEKNSALGFANGHFYLRDYPRDTTRFGPHGLLLFLELEKEHLGLHAQ
jgi:hypothetical protein